MTDKVTKVTVQTTDPKLIKTKTTTTSTGEVVVDKKSSSSSQYINSAWEQTAVVKPDIPQEDLSDAQVDNLMKLGKAKDFLSDPEGAKLADNLVKQGGDLSVGQRKWLKNQGVDPDAYMQQWTAKNNAGIVDKQKATAAKEEMAALSETFIDDQDKKTNKPRQPKKSFLKKLFNPDDKESVKRKGQDEQGVKVKIHSGTEERESDYLSDVSDDVAQEGVNFLGAHGSRADGKKKVKIKEYDESGNVVKTKVKYDSDGDAVSVKNRTIEPGKLFAKEKFSVKEHKDGDISVKGDLNADYVYGRRDAVQINNNNTEITKKETITTVTDNDWLQEKTITRREEVTPDPIIDTSRELHGHQVMDTPNRTSGGQGFKNVQMDSGFDIRDTANKQGVGYLLDGYCGNKAAAKDTISTEAFKGNLNQQNAKHITGCFIHADTENGWAPDYGKLNELIGAAHQRDSKIVDMAGAGAGNQILPFIKLELEQHNAHYNKGSGGSQAPNSFNGPVDMSQFPEWFQKMPNAEQLAVK